MKHRTGILGIVLITVAGWADGFGQIREDRIIAAVNEHKKPMAGKVLLKSDRDMNALKQLPVLGKALYLEDSIEAAASIRKMVKRKNYSDEMVYRRVLGLQGVVDVDLKVFRFKANTFKEVLSKITLDMEPGFLTMLKDTGYSDIGYSVTKDRGSVSVLIAVSKRYVDFIPGTYFRSDEGGIYEITVSGHSRLQELYYDTDMAIPESGGFFLIKPRQKKRIELDKKGNFTITVPTTSKENSRWNILGYFDKNDNLVAYNPFYGFGNPLQDTIR